MPRALLNVALSAFAAITAVVLMSGCGQETAAVRTQQIDAATFGGDWPLTVTSGQLVCTEAGRVYFSAPGSKVYAFDPSGTDPIVGIVKGDPERPETKAAISRLEASAKDVCPSEWRSGDLQAWIFVAVGLATVIAAIWVVQKLRS